MPSPFYVTAAEITRNFGMWQDRAGQAPVIVTHHGRSRCILLSAAAYEDLSRGQVVAGAESEQPLVMDALTEEIDVALLQTDAQCLILEANTNAAICLGTGRNTLAGQPLTTLCPDLGEGLVGGRLRRVLQTGERQRIRHSVLGRLADIHIFPSPGGVTIAWRSAEERDAFQRFSIENAALYRLLSMDGRMGTVRLSPRATIVQADPAFCTMCGIATSRLVNARFIDLVSRNDRAMLNEAIEQAFGSARQAIIDVALVANDGAEIPVQVAMTVLHEEFGIGGLMMMIRDRRTN